MTGKKLMTLLIPILLIACMTGTASAKEKVVFYEQSVSAEYKKDSGYSQFTEALKSAGYEVDKLELKLSKDALESFNPDVLIILNLDKELSDDESTALFEFVMNKGKGLFICGATPAVNKFTIPRGMTVDENTLEDETNRIRDMSTETLIEDETIFYIDLPSEHPDPVIKILTKGVKKLHFFEGAGIYVFGDAEAVVTGDDDTNTPTALRFIKGTYPPIAAYARVGKGSVFILSDPDMLSNQYLNTAKYRHNNLKFGLNIIDWLSSNYSRDRGEDTLIATLEMLNSENKEFNRTLRELQGKNDELNSRVNQLGSEKAGLEQKVGELEQDMFLWFSYQTWAIILLVIAVAIATLVIMKRTKKGEKEEGLGYEFGEKMGEDEFSPNVPGVEKQEVEERLKEFEKKSE